MGILDSLSTSAQTAYGLRLLKSAYAGACIRVRRSSDNTEQDIGFSGGVLDTASMATFVGVNSGFVSKWYDQSGNSSRDAVQATAGKQPRIVNAGTNETLNGRVAVNFLRSAGSFLQIAGGASWLQGTAYYIASIAQLRSVGATPQFICGYDVGGTTNQAMHAGYLDATHLRLSHWGNDQDFAYTADTNAHIHHAAYLKTGSRYYLDDISLGNGSLPSADLSGTNNFRVGCGYFSSFYGADLNLDGWITENIAFSAVLSGGDKETLFSDQLSLLPNAAGTSAGTSTASSTITGKGAVAGSSAGVGAATITVTGVGAVTGSSAGVGAASATMSAKGAVAGTSAGIGAASATAIAVGAVAGSAAGTGAASATITGIGAVVCTSAGVGAGSATVIGKGAVAGTSAGTSTASATMAVSGAISGAAAGTSTAASTMTGLGALSGATAGAGAGSATATGLGAVAGVAAGTSTASASLTSPGTGGVSANRRISIGLSFSLS